MLQENTILGCIYEIDETNIASALLTAQLVRPQTGQPFRRSNYVAQLSGISSLLSLNSSFLTPYAVIEQLIDVTESI